MTPDNQIVKPDYPAALWVPAHPSNYRASRRALTDIHFIVIHITSGRARAQPVADEWQKPEHGSTAHIVIGQDATVIQAVRFHDIAWHAHLINKVSIGVEHCAREPHEPKFPPDDPGLPASEAQLQASATFSAWFCDLAGWTPSRDNIVGHSEIDGLTTHKNCPQTVIDLDDYVKRVQTAYAALRQPTP